MAENKTKMHCNIEEVYNGCEKCGSKMGPCDHSRLFIRKQCTNEACKCIEIYNVDTGLRVDESTFLRSLSVVRRR